MEKDEEHKSVLAKEDAVDEQAEDVDTDDEGIV